MNAPFAAQIEASFRAEEYDPTYQLERLVREARRDMGEARWNQLQAEWDAPRPVRQPDWEAIGIDYPEGRS